MWIRKLWRIKPNTIRLLVAFIVLSMILAIPAQAQDACSVNICYPDEDPFASGTPEVPEDWFIIVFVIAVGLALIFGRLGMGLLNWT